jgi:hypothetical protein
MNVIHGRFVMAHTNDRQKTHQKIRSIRNAQRKIRDRIKQIIKQLKHLESIPGSQPWVTFRRVQTIKELNSPHHTLKSALKQDLIVLKSELRQLHRDVLNVRLQPAERANQDFEKELERTLKVAEKDGTLAEGDLVELRAKAESVLQQYVNILKVAPTEKNIERVLSKAETPLLLGSDTDSGTCGKALNAVAGASEKLVAHKDRLFRKNPTVDNFDKLLQSKANAQLVGGRISWQPKNWKPARTTHKVRAGETLSILAKRYYGNMGHWDVIYLENFGVIGDDLKKLRVGITLTIP